MKRANSILDAFLNLVFGTDFQVTDDEGVQQGISICIYEANISLNVGPCAGVWLCGAKNANAIIVNVDEDMCNEMTVSIGPYLKWGVRTHQRSTTCSANAPYSPSSSPTSSPSILVQTSAMSLPCTSLKPSLKWPLASFQR